jgi:hypothetical protein
MNVLFFIILVFIGFGLAALGCTAVMEDEAGFIAVGQHRRLVANWITERRVLFEDLFDLLRFMKQLKLY